MHIENRLSRNEKKISHHEKISRIGCQNFTFPAVAFCLKAGNKKRRFYENKYYQKKQWQHRDAKKN